MAHYSTPIKSHSKLGEEPSDNVAFGSNGLLAKSDNELLETVNSAVNNPENLIGFGSEAEVYKVPETDYCVRVPYGSKSGIGKNKVSRTLRLEDIVNHNVAKFDSGATLMKYIEGFTFCTGEISNEKVSQMIDEMPQESFNKLLKQISFAQEQGMYFDSSYRNIIINPIKKTMTAIDFGNNLSPDLVNGIFSALTPQSSTLQQKKTCAGKLLNAILGEMQPQVKPCLSPMEFRFEPIIHNLQYHGAFTSSKYPEVFISKLNDVRNLKIKELETHSVKNELNGSLKVAKALVKQLLR